VKRLVVAALALLFAGLWLAYLRPATLGGDVSYVIVDGDSMEPAYRDGDLVIAEKRASYGVGDVITYRAGGELDDLRLIIHRIVGGSEAEGFVTQGDNRDRTDPWSPTSASIKGATRWHLPYAGRLLDGLRNPVTLGVLGALAAALGGRRIDRKLRAKRRLRSLTAAAATLAAPPDSMEPAMTPPTSPPPVPAEPAAAPGRRARRGGPRWAMTGLAISVVAALVVVPLAWLALRTSETSVETRDAGSYEYVLEVAYRGVTEPSLVYPDGVVRSTVNDEGAVVAGGPLYDQLLDRLVVDYAARASGEGPARESLQAVLDVTATLTTPDGWSTELTRTGPVALDGGEGTASVRIDLLDARAQVALIGQLTGVGGEAYTIALEPTLSIVTTGPEGLVTETVAQPLTFTASGNVMAASEVPATSGGKSFVERLRVPNDFDALGVSMSPRSARSLLTGLSLVALAAVAGFAAVLFGGVGLPHAQRIAARYRSRIVDVSAPTIPPGPVVFVGGIDELARIAKAEQAVILHEDLGDGAHRYRVILGAVTYEYVTMPDSGAFAAEPEATSPDAASAPAPPAAEESGSPPPSASAGPLGPPAPPAAVWPDDIVPRRGGDDGGGTP
jgi:signal peptidase I